MGLGMLRKDAITISNRANLFVWQVDVRDALGRTPLMHAARFGSEGCVLRLLSHGAARYKKDKAGRMTASDLAIAAGHLPIAGIVSADPKWLDLMEIAAQVCYTRRPLLLLSSAE